MTVTAPKTGFTAKAVLLISLATSLSLQSGLSAAAEPADLPLRLLDSPAAPNSHLSRIMSDESGQIYLSWVTEEGDLARFYYSTLNADDWSTPVEISSGADWFVNWADFPMLSVNSGNKTAHWLRMSAEGTYDYNIEASFFSTENQQWSQARVIHNDGVSAEHGFVSMLPMTENRTMITWLDGRNTKIGDGYGEMTLRAGVFDSKGGTVDEWELDSRVCDCCQTSSAMTAKGPIVVFRDRSSEEIRDIAAVRYINGKWSEPQLVHEDNWQIAGCPVNGPSVSAHDEKVAVAWFTAKDDLPKVQLVLSDDSGANFGDPILVASSETNGRVGTSLLDSGKVVVSWIETNADATTIMLSVFSPDGELLQTAAVAQTSPSRRSGFPVITSVGERVYISWTDISNGPSVRVARALIH